MALFEYLCECGHTEAHQSSMKDAPPLGHQRPCGGCGGSNLTRVLSLPTIADAKLRFAGKYPYTSRQFSDLPGCRQTPEGHSVIESAAHERSVIAASRDTACPLVRD